MKIRMNYEDDKGIQMDTERWTGVVMITRSEETLTNECTFDSILLRTLESARKVFILRKLEITGWRFKS